MTKPFKLAPTQLAAFEKLLAAIPAADCLVLRGEPGTGKTTILRAVLAAAGGGLLGVRDFLNALVARTPEAIEEAFLAMLDDAVARHRLVLVDDLDLVTSVVESCDYARTYLLDAALTAVLGEAAALAKTLVFASSDEVPWPIRRRAYTVEIGDFTPEDYRAIAEAHLGEAPADRLDCGRIHRFAPALNGYQLKNACSWLVREQAAATECFFDYLRSQNLSSNVEIEEVPRADWSDLKGVDDVIHALETKIALPFENDELSCRYDLKPKRGVLLAGPPGTGKTTIGRALAHRLKGKFFLIDGTAIADSRGFYNEVGEIFEAAKRNAPSVVFIDDTDVIFEGNGNPGFYRYLLTMLDGLESARAGRVCVMMTAMHAGSLPAAILRSGRVELWLETRLPDAAARTAILREKLARLPEPIGAADVETLTARSRGLTGADLQAVVEDGKLLFAGDVASGARARPPEEYFLDAIETVRANRTRYARGGRHAAGAVGFVTEQHKD